MFESQKFIAFFSFKLIFKLDLRGEFIERNKKFQLPLFALNDFHVKKGYYLFIRRS